MKITRLVDVSDQIRAADLIFDSDRKWTVVRGSDLEEGQSQGLPVWSEHVGDPVLESNMTRRVDFALFMVDALTNDDLIQVAPAIVGRCTPSAVEHADGGLPRRRRLRLMSRYELQIGYVPGAIGRITELHGVYYHDHWGFDLFFEAKMATELASFLESYDPERDGLWTAAVDGRIEGSIAIDGRDARASGAELRWFIASDALRGAGAGHELLEAAMAFCREKGYASASLWTFAGLDVARHLYEEVGFKLAEERIGTKWGTEVLEQRFEWRAGHPGEAACP